MKTIVILQLAAIMIAISFSAPAGADADRYIDLSPDECEQVLTQNVTEETFVVYANSSCMKWLADRSKERRAELRDLDRKCSNGRIKSTAGRAETLYYQSRQAAPDPVKFQNAARKLRKKYANRKGEMKSCWATMVGSLESASAFSEAP